MPASLGQRCLVVLGQVGLPVIALIIYLDGGPDAQPVFMFVLLALGDILNIMCIFWNMWTCPEFQRFESYAQMFDFFFKLRKVYTVQLVCTLLKLLCEALLFSRLVIHVAIPYWVIMIPFWTILTIILYDLSCRIYRIQSF